MEELLAWIQKTGDQTVSDVLLLASQRMVAEPGSATAQELDAEILILTGRIEMVNQVRSKVRELTLAE